MLTAFSVYTPVDRATQAFVIDEVDEIPDRFVTWEPLVSTHATGTSSKHTHTHTHTHTHKRLMQRALSQRARATGRGDGNGQEEETQKAKRVEGKCVHAFAHVKNK